MGENGKFVMMDGTLVWVPDFSKQSINNNDVIDFIIKEEGFLKKPKDIGDGKITIGSGLTDPKWIELYKARGNEWSDEDNRMAVAEEVQKRREWNEENVPNWERLSPSAQNALLSYRYNYNYTRDNSPKLFKALEDFNLSEAAKQMDAASGNSKFTKGLGDRREREQNLFLSDYNQEPPIFNTEPEVPISTKVATSYPIQLGNTVRKAAGPYKDEYIVTESEKRRQQLRKAFKAKQDYNRIMEATNLQNTATPQFAPASSLFAKGGLLEPKDAWDRLSIPEKADIIKVGVKHGIFDLQELRKKYNEFKEGESKEEEEEVNTDRSYINTMERVAEENYRKWEHGEGGNLYKGGGIIGMPALPGISLRAAIAKRLYENTDALDGYDVGKFVSSVVTGDSSNNLKNTREHLKFKLSQDPSDNDITRRWKGELNQTDIADELYAQYLGIPVKDRHTKVRLSKSPYRSGSYRMPITNAEWDKIISETDDLNVGENTSTGVFRTAGLNTSAIGKGHDEKGEYRSYGDSFDLNLFRGSAAIKDIPGLNKINDLSLGLFNPVEVYDRVYLDDYYGVPKEDRGGNYLPEIVITGKKNRKAFGGNMFSGGGSKEEVNTIIPYTQRTEVVITPDTEYNQYLNTLPDNQRFTPNDKYDSYFYWKLNGKPKNFEEAYAKGMFNYDHSDNGYHANSIAFDDNTGIGYFMKPKDHDTVGFELDWFNKGLVTEEGGKQRPVTPEEAVELNEFRKNYLLTDDPDRPNYYMYQPIKHSIGGPLVDAANYRSVFPFIYNKSNNK